MLEAWAGQVFEFDSASCKHVFQFHLACSMAKRHHKKSAYQATRDEIDPELRLRGNISDLFLSGDIPAKRARNLFADASAARASNVEDLGAVAEGGNTHRDLLRKLQKNSKMPPLYEAPIPMWNPNTNQREVQKCLGGRCPHQIRSFRELGVLLIVLPALGNIRREQTHPFATHPVEQELLPQEWRNNPCYFQGPMLEFSCMLAELLPYSGRTWP